MCEISRRKYIKRQRPTATIKPAKERSKFLECEKLWRVKVGRPLNFRFYLFLDVFFFLFLLLRTRLALGQCRLSISCRGGCLPSRILCNKNCNFHNERKRKENVYCAYVCTCAFCVCLLAMLEMFLLVLVFIACFDAALTLIKVNRQMLAQISR